MYFKNFLFAFFFTRRRTLYLRSSGDGNIDESSINKGAVTNRSLAKNKHFRKTKIRLFIKIHIREFCVIFEPFHIVVQLNNDFQYQVLLDMEMF